MLLSTQQVKCSCDSDQIFSMLLHRGQDLVAHLIQHCLVAPGCFGDQMMQRLAHGLGAGRIQTRCHRFDALAFARKEQSFAVVFQRLLPVLVPRGLRQAFHVRREALLLWAWRGEPLSHETILLQKAIFVTQ